MGNNRKWLGNNINGPFQTKSKWGIEDMDRIKNFGHNVDILYTL